MTSTFIFKHSFFLSENVVFWSPSTMKQRQYLTSFSSQTF